MDGAKGAFPNPSFGQLEGLGVALFVLLVILALFPALLQRLRKQRGGAARHRRRRLCWRRCLGVMHFHKVVSAPWVDVVAPLRFGLPKFQLVPIVTMCIVMIVVMIELTGMFLALGEMTGRRIDQAAITRGRRRHDPRRHFQHVPLHAFFAECRSRWRYRRALSLGHSDWRSHWTWCSTSEHAPALVEAVPVVVLGGAGIVMFGMVAATGARILTVCPAFSPILPRRHSPYRSARFVLKGPAKPTSSRR